MSLPDVDCGRVPAILKGEVSYINGTTYLASQVAYECTPGNRLSGHRVRFCGPDGRWTGTSPKCEEVRCEAPGLPTNGSAIYIGNDRSFKEQSFSVGVTVQYECDYGHVVKGTWSSRLCQANGEWSGEPPVCKFVDCGTPPSIENGNYVLKHPPAGSVGSATPVETNRRSDGPNIGGTFTYYGTIAHYNCDANYKIQGPAQRECLDSGQWRTPLPTCEPIQCPKPEHFDEFTQVSLVSRANQAESTLHSSSSLTSNEQQSLLASIANAKSVRLIANNQWINHDSSQSFGVGDKLYYSCIPGYELYGGPEIRTCTQYGQWSGSSTPRCRLIDCGRPAPIGQEGRFFLLNESTTFNSLVEYSCVRPFKLVEVKMKQAGNLIETLTAAQAGVTPILTSLPIGVKVCANNGQWMPNDQQPRCVSPTSDGLGNGQFDGSDNTLEGSQRVQVSVGSSGSGSSPATTFIGATGNGNSNQNNHDGIGDNHLDSASGQATNHDASTSLWAKVLIAICLMVMLTLIVLTLICIRSGKKPKQTTARQRTSILTSNGHHSVNAAAAAAAAMQLQLANGGAPGKNVNQHQATNAQQQQQQQQAVAAATMMSNQNAYINGAHKMYPNNMVPSNQLPAIHHNHHALNQAQLNHSMAYGDASVALGNGQGLMLASNIGRTGGVVPIEGCDMMMNGKSSSLGVLRHNQANDLAMSVSSASMMDSCSRLSIDSENRGQSSNLQANNKTIRHNPNGLVTFVSPIQQQQQQQHSNSRVMNTVQQQSNGTTSQSHQVSPQSISTSLSLSSSSSPSSSSSAHHTTATRLSTTDSASSSSSSSNINPNNGYQQVQHQQPQEYIQVRQQSPPSLPAHPPPSHRLQQHHKQLLKQQQQLNARQPQAQPANRSMIVDGQTSQLQQPTSNHHYMEPKV